MIKVFYPGLYGSADDLFKLHQLRAVVFKEKMGWDVDVNEENLEFDQFDTAQTVYVTAHDNKGQMVGCCRLLSCEVPFMISEVWPEYFQSITIPRNKRSWELSRFAVYDPNKTGRMSNALVNSVTTKLFYGVTCFCMAMGIDEVYAMHDHRVQAVVKRIGCIPTKTSEYINIDNIPCCVGCYKTDKNMQDNLRAFLTKPVQINFDSEMFVMFSNHYDDQPVVN